LLYYALKQITPFIDAIVIYCMNLNNNHKIENLMAKTTTNFKALFMGILLIVSATFSLLTSNTIATESFAQSTNNVVGCAHVVTVTISGLPKQTDDSNTQVPLSNIHPNEDKGEANINIPGIGSGHVFVAYSLNSNAYFAYVFNIPGQNGPSFADGIPATDVCSSASPHSVNLVIPGNIGSGSLAMIRVN
jgi:hypothetical protein